MNDLLEAQKMMKKVFSPKVVPLLFICMIFLLVPSVVARADETATVDDLFSFFIEKWMKPFSQGTIVAPPNLTASKLISSFLEDLKNAESRFGQLPEYWELRAFVDLRPEDKARTRYKHIEPEMPQFTVMFDTEMQLNPLLLEQALKLNPNLPAVQWHLGNIQALDSWPEGLEKDAEGNYPKPPDKYNEIIADSLAEAGKSDPANGFYSFMEATYRGHIGDYDKALQLLDTGSKCEKFSIPSIFPQDYFLSHLDDLGNRTGAFKDLRVTEIEFLLVIFDNLGATMNFVEIKNVYKEIIKQALENDNWRDTFTVLHRAACRMGRCEHGDFLNSLVARILIGLCRDEAVKIAKEKGDEDLEDAMMGVGVESYLIRQSSKIMSDTTLSDIFHFIFVNYAEEMQTTPIAQAVWNRMYGPDMSFDEDVGFMLKDLIAKRPTELSKKYIWPIFDRLEKLDYSKPKEWYDWWLNGGDFQFTQKTTASGSG